jgi:hypothetical protein
VAAPVWAQILSNAVLLVDKPTRWSGADVVRQLKSALKVDRVCFGAPLEMEATGLLIILLGKHISVWVGKSWTVPSVTFQHCWCHLVGASLLAKALGVCWQAHLLQRHGCAVSDAHHVSVNNPAVSKRGDVYLLCAIGSASRLTPKLEPLERTYTGTFRLGRSTTTYDAR